MIFRYRLDFVAPFYLARNSHISLLILQARSSSAAELHGSKSSLESLFCYDKAIPEEIIDKPAGLSLSKKEIGSNPPCIDCQEKGAILCATCSGCGLYIDSILESQGVIVKVKCLGKKTVDIFPVSYRYDNDNWNQAFHLTEKLPFLYLY